MQEHRLSLVEINRVDIIAEAVEVDGNGAHASEVMELLKQGGRVGEENA